MLDLGFIDDIQKIAEYLPPKRQTLLFSATYSKEIKQLADQLLDELEVVPALAIGAPVVPDTSEIVATSPASICRSRSRRVQSELKV